MDIFLCFGLLDITNCTENEKLSKRQNENSQGIGASLKAKTVMLLKINANYPLWDVI